MNTTQDTLTDRSIIDKMHEFNTSGEKGIAFTLAMQEDDGSISYYERESQACWGELRRYNKQIDGYTKPGDLHAPMPKGTVVGIGIHLNIYDSQHKDLYWWMLGSDSPWKNNLPCIEPSIKKGKDWGFVVVNTHLDPTVFVQMLLNLRHRNHNFSKLLQHNIHPKVAFLLAKYNMPNKYFKDTYRIPYFIDLKRWWNSDPDTSITPGGLTFYQGGNYHRPNITDVWKGETDLYKKYGSGITLEQALKAAPKLQEQMENT